MIVRFVGDILFANSAFDLGFGFLDRQAETRLIKKIDNNCDYVVGNLEFCITNTSTKKSIKQSKHLSDTSSIYLFEKYGIDFLSLANNHILQHGENVFQNTKQILTKNQNIDFFGTKEKPYLSLEDRENEICILSASMVYDKFCNAPNNFYQNIHPPLFLQKSQFQKIIKSLDNWKLKKFISFFQTQGSGYQLKCDFVNSNISNKVLYFEVLIDAILEGIIEYKFFSIIRKLKEKNCQIILYIHWGDEYIEIPAPWQRKFAHKLVDIGVDAIVGGHSHTVQGIEVYKEVPIFYSLGNFFFNTYNPYASTGLVVDLIIDSSKTICFDYKFAEFDNNTLTTSIITNLEKIKILEKNLASISMMIDNNNYYNYYIAAKEGIVKSRYYKRKHLIKNIFKIPYSQLIRVVLSYILRITRRILKGMT